MKGGTSYLENRKADENPVLQLRVNNSVVKVMFSRSDGMDVKNRVRDILTESYEERFQKEIMTCGQSG